LDWSSWWYVDSGYHPLPLHTQKKKQKQKQKQKNKNKNKKTKKNKTPHTRYPNTGGTLGEPFENNGQAISSIPYSRSFTQYFLGSQEGFGKMYPWLHQQAIQEGFQNLTQTSKTSCEFMSLTRSTFIGGQRFCSYLWSGDTESRFDVLLQQITAAVSIAASGISSWTLDIGGFAGLDIDTDEVSVVVSFFGIVKFFADLFFVSRWIGKGIIC
jgi:hypothetical protein